MGWARSGLRAVAALLPAAPLALAVAGAHLPTLSRNGQAVTPASATVHSTEDLHDVAGYIRSERVADQEQ